MSKRTVHRTCPLCEATCGLELEVEGDRVTRIRGDASDVFSGGFICPKGTTLAALHEDPDRLRTPLVKRDGEHVPVSWDEAFREVERGLLGVAERHGREALGAYVGNPNVHNLAGTFYLRPVLKALGTRQIYSASTADQMPRHVSCGLMFGDPGAIPVPDVDRTDLLVMLGANPVESGGSLCTAPDFPGRLRKLRERGGRLVVIDPRRTRTAELADLHLAPRPGSDAALLAAVLHTVFDEQLDDTSALADHTVGIDALREAVAPFAPERVAATCGIDAEAIRSLAREIAVARSAAVYGRIGVHTCETGTITSFLTDAIALATGNLDAEGGSMFPFAAHARAGRAPGGKGFRTGRWKSRVRGLPEVRGEFPVAALAEEIDTEGEGRIRGLLTIAGNPVLSTPDAARLDRALEDLEFMVSVDIYCNETTRHADVILPPPSPLERSHYDIAFYSLSVRNVANWSPAVFEHEGPSESDILARLALILGGAGADAPASTVDDMLLGGMLESLVSSEGSPVHGRDAEELAGGLVGETAVDRLVETMLRAGPYGDGFGVDADGLSLEQLRDHPHGIDLGALAPRIPDALSTPSAKIEAAPAPILEEMARLAARLDEAPEPLVLVGRRDVRSNNSWMHNVDALVRGRVRCTLKIHPDDAAEQGLSDGDLARVSSRAGELTVAVEHDAGIRRGVVSLPHGWGHDTDGARLQVAAQRPGVNSNVLTDASLIDPLSGNAVLNGIPVQIAPAA